MRIDNSFLHDEIQQLNKKLEKENELMVNENKQLKEKISNIEDTSLLNKVQQLEKKVKKLKGENKEMTIKNKTYENYLSSLKEKSSELIFFDLEEYVEESSIGEGGTSTVKIVHKEEQEKYAKKELSLFDHKSMQRFLGECEILFPLNFTFLSKNVKIYQIKSKHNLLFNIEKFKNIKIILVRS